MQAMTPWERLDAGGIHGARLAAMDDAKIGTGTSRAKCAQCGERFELVKRCHVYKRSRNGDDKWFCSWSCMRAWDKTKKAAHGNTTSRKLIIPDTLEGCREKIAEYDRRIDGYADRIIDAAMNGDFEKIKYMKGTMVRLKSMRQKLVAAAEKLEAEHDNT